MNLPDRDKYLPSANVLNSWLATRKNVFTISGTDLMPLFSDTGYANDKMWYNIAWGLEILGLIATIYGGLMSGGVFGLIAIAVVFIFMFVDFMFIAPRLHRNEAKFNFLRAKRQILDNDDDNQRSEIRKIDLELNKQKDKIIDGLLIFALVVMAVLKTLGIVILGAFDSTVLYVGFFILFLIIVYAHVYKTRYAIAYMQTQKLLNNDYISKTTNNQFGEKEYPGIFYTKKKLEEVTPVKYNNKTLHFIKHLGEEDGLQKYKIIATNLLTDDDLRDLATGQSDDNNALIIAKAARILQIENYGIGLNVDKGQNVGRSFGKIKVDKKKNINADLNNDL